ncbi:YihY/virulence factor BrkB family protein [Pikeienuella sp. HZG-20]|uniref:YihY/virulence factor BrkB family protein n=1 Tax=Paludibacillus litoralis TaxID=3133267 RepID=UPI0030EEF612
MSRARDLALLLYRAYQRFEEHDGFAFAGFIAFSVFLSLFPFAIFFSALAGILIGPEDSRAVFNALVHLAPDHIVKTLLPVLDEVLGQRRGGLLTLSGLGAIWVASNGVEALRVGLDKAYQVSGSRGFIRRRLTALGFVLLAAVTFTLLGFLIILAPLALKLAHEWTGFQPPVGIGVVRYLMGVLSFALFLFTLNRWLPSSRPRWRAVVPGIVVSTLLWISGASAFSIYLAFAPSYTVTYGAFAGVIVTLLFFYLTGAVVIYGAEVNAARLAARHERAEEEEDA